MDLTLPTKQCNFFLTFIVLKMQLLFFMKNLSILFFVALATFFCSFVGIREAKENPGTITFITDAGMPSTFTIMSWQFTKCDITPDAIEKLQVEAEMDMGSISSSWKELEKNIKKKKDYFYVKHFPTATLSINGATKVKDNEYTCNATLTLRKVAHPVVLSFTTTSDEKGLNIKGSGTVNRRDHAFTGDGPKDLVPVNFEFVVKK
jgi:polyisoprenoid-binding protein YceI